MGNNVRIEEEMSEFFEFESEMEVRLGVSGASATIGLTSTLILDSSGASSNKRLRSRSCRSAEDRGIIPM